MKKYLLVSFLFFIFGLFLFVFDVNAQVNLTSDLANEGTWVQDSEVTFLGKAASRSALFLNSILKSPEWYFLGPQDSGAFSTFWINVRNIVYAFFALFVLITAFIVIITRGRNITVLQFVPRFIGIVILVTFSFAIMQLLYQITDIVSGFFLKRGGSVITSFDIINVSYDYREFVGYRLIGGVYDESAFISLLLIKLTTVTSYLIGGILLIRKIILWFFMIISPIFPLLLLYSPIRNSGKIWLSEFFRWLFYAPLFSIFLSTIVSIWGSGIFKPNVNTSEVVYPTAINILLGAPQQNISVLNSLNTSSTFLLYVLALVMLWVAIIVPFILLKIFLNYFQSLSISKDENIKRIINMSSPLFAKNITPIPPNNPPKTPVIGTGMAKTLPFLNKNTFSEVQSKVASPTSFKNYTQNINQNANNQIINSQQLAARTSEILKSVDLKIPTLRDIGQYETSLLSSRIEKHEEISKMHETLEKIASPNFIDSYTEKQKFTQIREQLGKEGAKGNPSASAVLSASGSVSKSGLNNVVELPLVNKVQTVSLDDYESIKKYWEESYQSLDVPEVEKGREEWIQKDTDKIQNTISLLTSEDKEKIKEGMKEVSSILPFLLIGGFSHQEVIAYLKAKQEAGKNTLSKLKEKKEEEESQIEVSNKTDEKPKEMEMAVVQDLNESNVDNGKQKIENEE